jgi:hypothetical protein
MSKTTSCFQRTWSMFKKGLEPIFFFGAKNPKWPKQQVVFRESGQCQERVGTSIFFFVAKNHQKVTLALCKPSFQTFLKKNSPKPRVLNNDVVTSPPCVTITSSSLHPKLFLSNPLPWFHFVAILCRGFRSFVAKSLWMLLCTCRIEKVCIVQLDFLRCLLLELYGLVIGFVLEPSSWVLNLGDTVVLWLWRLLVWWTNPCWKYLGLHWFQELVLEVIVGGFGIHNWEVAMYK